MTSRHVAAIIPYFEGQRFLADALSSALAQTHAALEIIVVNDGSPDDFHAAIAPFRSRVRVIEQTNRGVAAARNRGLAETEADFIAFLDQDDVWVEHKIERQVKFMEERAECGLLHTAVSYIDANGAPTAGPPSRLVIPRAEGHCALDLLAHNTIAMSSVLLRRQALGEERFAANLGGSDDWDLWLRLSRSWPFAYVDEPLTRCRLHGRNVSARHDVMVRGRVRVLERELERAAPENRRQVARRLRTAITDLAHLEYEQGNLRAARALFAAGSRSGRDAAVRYLATFLPPFLYPRVRHWWRALRATHDQG